jgi:exopolysaccharide production protein ExoQ
VIGTAPATRPPMAARSEPAGEKVKLGFASFTFFTLFAGDAWRDSISWYGWGVMVGIGLVGSIVYLVRARPHIPVRKWPKTLVLFLLLCLLSIAWSAYRPESALGTIAQLATSIGGAFFAICLSWRQILSAMGAAFRAIIGLSLLFELVVAVVIGHHIVPFWTDYGSGKLPNAYYWSRDLLFHGGQIQGIVGNSDILCMMALLALIVFGVQLADRTVGRTAGIVWLVLAAVTYLLTRSSTVVMATAAVIIVLLFVWWARSVAQSRRVPLYVTAVVVLAAGLTILLTLWSQITAVLGKSITLTGRTDIWTKVIDLTQQKPVLGWGWISYWAPWVEPFKGLAVRNRVEYLQAHDAYLDVGLQLGIVGVILFVLLVLSTFGRTWFFAVDRPPFDARGIIRPDVRYSATTLLPLLIMTAMIGQSFTESRMLIEGGFATLVMLSIKTKLDRP